MQNHYDIERSIICCSCDACLLQDATVPERVVIFADLRQTQRWSERDGDPLVCARDLAFSLISLQRWIDYVSGRTQCVFRKVEDLTFSVCTRLLCKDGERSSEHRATNAERMTL